MKKSLKYMDKPLFIATIIMCIIGLVMVFSASSVASVLQYKVSTYYFFKKQLIVMGISFFLGIFIILKMPISKYHHFRVILMLGIIGALAGLFFYGKLTNNALSWYNLGIMSVQPSEFAKTIIIIYLASFFGKNINSERKFYFLKPLLASGIVIAEIFFQPDLGTAAIIGLSVFLIFMAIPFDKKDKDVKLIKTIGVIGIIFIIGIMTFGGELLNSMQLSRLTYKEPCTRYVESTGYQVCNGMIAINNGGLFGVGLGNSTQKYLYLPEAHTDFIFPIIVEELGSIPATGIILLYIFILVRIIRIAKQSKNLTNSIIAYGTFTIILLHIIINLGGILALIPLTGVPLPLLSYGGSITLNTLALIFMCLRVSIENNISKEKFLKQNQLI